MNNAQRHVLAELAFHAWCADVGLDPDDVAARVHGMDTIREAIRAVKKLHPVIGFRVLCHLFVVNESTVKRAMTPLPKPQTVARRNFSNEHYEFANEDLMRKDFDRRHEKLLGLMRAGASRRPARPRPRP